MAGSVKRLSIPFAITVLGISHVITQITVIREFINVVSGNEVVLGVLFSLWLLLTGIGAWLGRFITSLPLQFSIFRVSLVAAAFLPIAHIIMIRVMRDFLFVRGVLPGIGPLIIWATVLLLPYCLLTGALLTLACSILPSYGPPKLTIGKVYFFDNLGDILGGMLFTFILVHFFNNLSILYVPAFLCLLGFIFTARRHRRLSRKFLISMTGFVGICVLLGLIMFLPLEDLTLKRLYPEQKIVDYLESPYGRVVVTKDYNQTSFFENGEHLFSTPNTFANEELVHFALPHLRDIQSVLLVSGGMSGIIDEIEKYDVRRIDYVELDPSIIKAGTKHLMIHFPSNVNIHLEDGRSYIEKTTRRYDAVILDLPDPSSLQLNRFYTIEFFRSVKAIVSNAGLICFGVQGAEHYISEDQARFLSTLHNTLKKVFQHVLIIPGDRNIFIASDTPLTTDIGPLIASRDVTTTYVNENYLTGRATAERLSFVRESIIPDIAVNRDFHPLAFFYNMRIWLAMFQERYKIPLVVVSVFFFLYFASIKIVNKALFSTGFTASSMEVIILLSYQVLHGSVYTGLGLIIAAFMFGLAMGSYTTTQLASVTKKTLLTIEAAIILYVLIFMLALFAGRSILGSFTFAVMAAVMGMLTGAEFPVSARLTFTAPWDTAGSLYAADLLGGSLGALVVSLFLIPTVGIYNTCLILIVFKLLIVSGLIVRMKS